MGRKFTFVLLCIRGQIPSTSPQGGGAYIRRGDLTEGFLRYDFGGLIHGGAYFREFYGMYTGTVIFGVESYLRLKTLQLKTCAENVLFLSWRTFFVGKYSI